MSTQVVRTSFNLFEKATRKIKVFSQLGYVQRYVYNKMKQNILNQMLIQDNKTERFNNRQIQVSCIYHLSLKNSKFLAYIFSIYPENKRQKRYEHFIKQWRNDGKLLSADEEEEKVQSYPAQKTNQGDRASLCLEMQKQNKA